MICIKYTDIKPGSHVVVLEKHKKDKSGIVSIGRQVCDADREDHIASSLSNGFRIVGIFPNMSPNRRDRYYMTHSKWEKHTKKPKRPCLQGVPEGKCLYYVYNYDVDKIAGTVDPKKFRIGEMIQYHDREKYADILKAINTKAKELMEMGVERKAAIKAARKCSCSH